MTGCWVYSRLDPDREGGRVVAEGREAGAGLLAVLAGVQGPGRHLRGQRGLAHPGLRLRTPHLRNRHHLACSMIHDALTI